MRFSVAKIFTVLLMFAGSTLNASDSCRLSMLTDVRTKNLMVEFKSQSGELMQMEGSSHLEYEKRFNFQLPMTVQTYSLYGEKEEANKRVVSNIEDLLKATILNSLIPNPNIMLRMNNSEVLRFSAYSFSGENFHSVDEIPSLGDSKEVVGKYEIELPCKPFTCSYSEFSWDHIFNRFLIGKQKEVSVYYDTPNGDLKKRGIAVREKKWSPSRGETNFEAQGLFVKSQSHKNPLSFYNRFIKGRKDPQFTTRNETHFKPKKILNPEDTVTALITILKEMDIHVSELVPVVQVENTRYGINMNWSHSFSKQEKIGFVVFDEYTSKVLRPDGSVQQVNPITYQAEFEIFPEYYDLVNQHYNQFHLFFHSFKRDNNAIEADTPKYIQALETKHGE